MNFGLASPRLCSNVGRQRSANFLRPSDYFACIRTKNRYAALIPLDNNF